MIYTIIDNILPYITALNFSDRVAGISYILELPVLTDNNQTVIKRFPAVQNTNKNQCALNDYVELIPDDSLKSLVYFELLSNNIQEENLQYQQYQATVRLTAWFNLRNINENLTNCEQLLQLINNAIPFRLDDFSNTYRITIETSDKRIRDKTIFSAYTYNEAEKQYLIYPFDFGHINLTINYRVDKCATDITIDPNPCNDLKSKPFVTVIDGGETVYLYAGETYTCSNCEENMNMTTINTGALVAGVQKEIAHNLGTSAGATDMEYRLYELNGQERFFNELYPKPTDDLNVLLLTVGENNPAGLLIKIIYKT